MKRQHQQQQQQQQQHQSVWERLYDPVSYTGVYAERFRTGGAINAHAHDGNIRDLSQITRPSFRTSTYVHIGKGWEPGQHANSGMLCDTPSTRRSYLDLPYSSPSNTTASTSSNSSRASTPMSRRRPASAGATSLRRSSFDQTLPSPISTSQPNTPKARSRQTVPFSSDRYERFRQSR